MPSFSSIRARNKCHQQIKKVEGSLAILRSSGGDRQCYVYLTDYSANEKRGELIQATDQLGLVAPFAPDDSVLAAPDNESEVLVRLHPVTGAEIETLRIVAPPGKLDPAGVVLYWEIQLRR